MLQVKDIRAGYGRIEILHGVSLKVLDSKIIAIVGPNGSGKSTLLKTIFGFVKPVAGQIIFEEQDITGFEPHDLLRRNLAFLLQRRSVFPDLSVLENLKMGAFIRVDVEQIHNDIERIFAMFPILQEKKSEKARFLSGGQQRMLELGRALMVHPKLMLLDEPSAGLSPMVVKEVFGKIRELNQFGVGFIIVEQEVKRVLEFGDYGYVLEQGEIRSEGNCDDLLNEDELIKLYLGDYGRSYKELC